MKRELFHLLIIGTGGFFGAIFRYLTGGIVHEIFHRSAFPYGTLVVNITGCLLIGFCSALVEYKQYLTPEARMFILIGFLGGYTTYSTFGFETMALMREGQFILAGVNVLVHVIVGLSAVWIGYNAIRFL